MFPVVVIPEITKGTESSIIYLPENVSFQMDLLFFFFYLKDIFTDFLLLFEFSLIRNKNQHSAVEKGRV